MTKCVDTQRDRCLVHDHAISAMSTPGRRDINASSAAVHGGVAIPVRPAKSPTASVVELYERGEGRMRWRCCDCQRRRTVFLHNLGNYRSPHWDEKGLVQADRFWECGVENADSDLDRCHGSEVIVGYRKPAVVEADRSLVRDRNQRDDPLNRRVRPGTGRLVQEKCVSARTHLSSPRFQTICERWSMYGICMDRARHQGWDTSAQRVGPGQPRAGRAGGVRKSLHDVWWPAQRPLGDPGHPGCDDAAIRGDLGTYVRPRTPVISNRHCGVPDKRRSRRVSP